MTRTGITKLFLLVLFGAACAPPVQVVPVTTAPVRPTLEVEPETPVAAEVDKTPLVPTGRFDAGKMWTFDHPPREYLLEEYGLSVDSTWLSRAKAAALRFGGFCSASFVSREGLVMTNHHCARESVSEAQEEGENLLDFGFVAHDRAEERKIEDLHLDQLITIEDVSEQIYAADRLDMSPTTRAADRERRAERLEASLSARAKAIDSTHFVEVVALYNGGRYSAYTYRRYEDVRLVMAPEVQVGFYGGDWDNFTFPRYNLDVSFFRAYGADGEPVTPDHYFPWASDGAEEGDPVFVVGNPGSTSRLATVSQLEYLRDHELPITLEQLEARIEILGDYMAEHPEETEEFDLRNTYFSLQNTRKSYQGQLDGLRSDWLIPRRASAEAQLKAAIAASDSLSELYRPVLDEVRAVQLSKEASVGTARAFAFFANSELGSRVLTRAMYGYVYNLLKQRGAMPQQLADIRKDAMAIEDWPARLDEAFIALRLTELKRSLGKSDPSIRRLFGDNSAEEVAKAIIAETVLTDTTGFVKLLDEGFLSSGDSSVDPIEVIGPLYFTQNQQLESFGERERALNARLGRAGFAINGHMAPPDATFSLRLSDGVVSGYSYNGTRAPAFTTFYGLYERYYASGGRKEWELPERWIDPADGFDFSTPINLVSTNDITGGNSGSPLLNKNLEVVGLVFDSNIDALPNEFLFLSEQGRTVSVDARGIIEALTDIYGATALVDELLKGVED